jgi:hypothetical protein
VSPRNAPLMPLDEALVALLARATAAGWHRHPCTTLCRPMAACWRRTWSRPCRCLPSGQQLRWTAMRVRCADVAAPGIALPVSQRIAAGSVGAPLQPAPLRASSPARPCRRAPMPSSCRRTAWPLRRPTARCASTPCRTAASGFAVPAKTSPGRRGAARGHAPHACRAGPGGQHWPAPAAGGAPPARGAVFHRRRTGHARRCAARADAPRRHLQQQPLLSARHAAAPGLRGDRLRHRARPARRHHEALRTAAAATT